VPKGFHLQPGQTPFPGYVLHLPLGRGACGEVWQACGPEGTTIALKFLECRNPTYAAKEVRSFQSLGSLYHPNLLRVFQVFLQPEYVVIAMELADGSLLDLLDAYAQEKGTAVKPELACNYISQAAIALDFLNSYQHDHDGRRVALMHCDIKPSNILLCGDSAKIADFGLSAPLSGPLEPHNRAGTLDFAAPEVYRGQLSYRTDQYALAITYCVVRGGRLPFHNPTGRFTQSYERGDPDLSMLSPPERQIIAKALSEAPINRWNSCCEMMAHLQGLFGPEARPASPSYQGPGLPPSHHGVGTRPSFQGVLARR
jgi:serine/threonine-protein kinase